MQCLGNEVGGVDVGGGGRGGAQEVKPMEQPLFGVQTIVVERSRNGAAWLSPQELCEGWLVQAQAAPLDEGAKQVYPLGGEYLVN